VCYGFVEFERKVDADAARKEENGTVWEEKTISVNVARVDQRDHPEIMVSNISPSLSEESVRSLFAQVHLCSHLPSST
jgi:RNA recognition motif-containing protein